MQVLPSFSSTIQSCNSCPSFTLKSSFGCCSTQTEVNAAIFIERDFSSREIHRLENKDLLHPTDAEINLSMNKEITIFNSDSIVVFPSLIFHELLQCHKDKSDDNKATQTMAESHPVKIFKTNF
jgi:hypothetical protein